METEPEYIFQYLPQSFKTPSEQEYIEFFSLRWI